MSLVDTILSMNLVLKSLVSEALSYDVLAREKFATLGQL